MLPLGKQEETSAGLFCLKMAHSAAETVLPWTEFRRSDRVPCAMNSLPVSLFKAWPIPRFVVWLCAGIVLVVLQFPNVAAAQTSCSDAGGNLNANQQPKLPVDEIIRRFAANDTINREARNHYTYTEDITIQTLTGTHVDGEYRTVTNISFDARGTRIESAAIAPVNSLSRIVVGQEDLYDIRNVMHFFLPTEDLPKYKIVYAGTQHIDEIDAYAFTVTPEKTESSSRRFQGCVWIDDHDLQIVKVRGRVVPDSQNNQSPTFETYREFIDGRFWFPTYTRADGILHFKAGDIHIREIVKCTSYKRPA